MCSRGSLLVFASLAFCAAEPATGAEDKKVYPGTFCQPRTADAGFRRDSFGQYINTSAATQQVFCPITQDSLGLQNDIELAEVRLFESSSADPPSCVLRIVNVFGSPAAQVEASESTKVGSRRLLRFGNGAPNVPVPEDSMLLLACTLPPQCAISSYSITENVDEP